MHIRPWGMLHDERVCACCCLLPPSPPPTAAGRVLLPPACVSHCSVFILDFSSEVEVSNCSNCQIFIGPVDGPAIFEGCTNCQVAVAANLFKANACAGCEFGIYSATQPAISASSSIRIGCWAGAYPLLTQHFAAAHLDPNNNQWNKVGGGGRVCVSVDVCEGGGVGICTAVMGVTLTWLTCHASVPPPPLLCVLNAPARPPAAGVRRRRRGGRCRQL